MSRLLPRSGSAALSVLPTLAAALLAAAWGCAGGSGSGAGVAARAAPLPSCWSLQATAADSALAGEREKTRLRLPFGVRLDTAKVDSARYRAETLREDGTRSTYPFAGWWPRAGGDSLEVGHPSAFSGLRLRMEAGDSVMTGTATPYSDVTRRGSGAASSLPVRALRTACP